MMKSRIFEPLGMRDTAFHVPPEEVDRFAACYDRGPGKKLRLQDDPRTSPYLAPPKLFSGGGGLISTAADYLRFCRMLLAGGELDGVRLLGPRTIEFMTLNHLPDGKDLTDLSVGAFSETPYEGTGFGPGFSVRLDPVRSGVIGSVGEYAWGGAASTIFWIDPSEDLIAIFLTQLMPSNTFNFRGQLQSIISSAVID